MSDSWTCLMVEKGPGLLDDTVCAALRKAACRLSLEGFDSMRFQETACEGAIETSWKTHSVGSRGGILFRSQVDADAGSYRVNFLLSAADLKRGEEILRRYEEGATDRWTKGRGRVPVPELYDFSDLSSVRGFE